MSMLDWANLCDAAGFNIRQLTPPEVYAFSQKIIQDEPLRQACMPFLNLSVLPKGTRADILRRLWSDDQRAQLRERVTGVIQFGKSSHT
jgi:hypothetical protein